jgi:CIC family chloride channel protein
VLWTRAKQHGRYAVAIAVVGILAGAFAIVFRAASQLVFERGYGAADVVRAFQRLPGVARLLLPAAGGAAAAALGVVASRRAGGHGVAEILEAVALGRGAISMRTTLWKALGSFAAIVSGGSIGREGPLLQVGAASGSTVAARLRCDPKRGRALVAAGTAAGFAAAYNTPIAAVLFVLEIVTGVITLDVALPAVVATVIATSLTRFALGAGPLYGLRTFSLQSSLELVAYAALGLLAGLVGPAFIALLSAGNRAFRRLPVPVPARGAIGGLIVGALALRLPEVTGNGYEVIQLMLNASYGGGVLVVLLLAKAIATTASVSSGSPGGVFTPSLFLGAATGGIAGALVHVMLPSHGFLGGYVLVGMAGAIAATTHAPVMATVLGFELSGDYAIVLPLMIATVLATVVARRLRRDSIYTEELRRRGIAWEGTLAQRVARTVRARDIFEMDPRTVDENAPVAAALDILAASRARVVFVTGQRAVRAIDLHRAAELWSRTRRLPEGATCGDVAVAVPSARPDDNLLDLSAKLFEVDWGEIPVIEPEHPGRPIGLVTRRALMAAFDRELLERDMLSTRVVWFEGQSQAADYLELPRGQRVEIIAPPPSAVGRPVDVAGLRSGARVNVLGVRRSSRATSQLDWLEPETVATTSADDRWIVVGSGDAIERLRTGR